MNLSDPLLRQAVRVAETIPAFFDRVVGLLEKNKNVEEIHWALVEYGSVGQTGMVYTFGGQKRRYSTLGAYPVLEII